MPKWANRFPESPAKLAQRANTVCYHHTSVLSKKRERGGRGGAEIPLLGGVARSAGVVKCVKRQKSCENREIYAKF